MTFSFEKLHVYQKSVDFADSICAITEQFPRGYGFLVDQLNRASVSIAANIAECNGRFTKADRKNFFGIARGSVQECVPLLELARRRGLIDDAKHAQLNTQLEEISKMLSGLINGLVRLWRSLPDVKAELGAMLKAEHDPRDPAYWKGMMKRDEARLTRRIKTLYDFYTLKRFIEDETQRKKAEDALLYLMA